MTKFLYVYHGGGKPASEAEGAKAMKAWMDWFGELGPTVIESGNPVGKSQTVLANGSVVDNGGSNPTSGYSIIDARDAADAAEKAKGCPILASGGSIEIAPIMEIG